MRRGQGLDVTGGDHEPVLAVPHRLGQTAARRRDDDRTVGHRLERHEAQALRSRGRDGDDAGPAQEADDDLWGQGAAKVDGPGVVARESLE